ncbi:EAL domain-containing protein [Thalassotalea euphylliae]|uniref:EAL domain-containing protein n=1 Tax=Thalassotalea euphylliae TaxID=1655234 RepID=A0A3E0U220_9GAMM|nr:EAL domain-containing protein [Thalassotalea euphylliae]REL31031.1 EAL domain-containing protein [Thalassotalea euphylliae]
MDLLSGRSVYQRLVAKLTPASLVSLCCQLWSMLFVMGLLSFSASASIPLLATEVDGASVISHSFTFIDFNIAFVLGLSLPMLLVVLLVRRLVPNPWWYFSALMLSALGFLYSLNYLTDNQAPAVLSFAITSIALVYLWSFASTNMLFVDHESEYFAHVKLGEKVLIAASVIYIGTIWLIPSIDAYIGWLAFVALVLFTGAVQIAMMAKIAPEHVIRLVGQWLLVGMFCGVIFFYLHAQVELEWLVISFVLSFCGALINSNWELVQRIYQLISEQKEVNAKQLTDEQIFSFTHDPATNLPSYQQAILRFEQLSFQNQLTDFAVVVVKPKNFTDVNRVLGHQNSDLLLLQLAYCLKREVAELNYLMNFDFSDINAKLARLPSLHFMLAVDLNKITHSKEIVVDELCRRLAGAVPPAMSFKSFSLRFELACGVAYTNEHGQTLAEVIAHAGDAVMEAQRRNALWVEFDAQVALHSDQQLQRMEHLKLDIQQDKVQCQLLPQIDLGNHQIRGFSQVATWYYNGENLPLEEFIDVAEQSGEIFTLSKKMIVHAFKALFELKKLNIYQPIGIPVLSEKLLEPDLAEFIEQQIATYNISAKYLVIQMSEPVMQAACEQAKNLIDQLKALEVKICIADFDGSYESLRYIRKLSVDQVNISCEPLCLAEAGSAEKAIVNSLVSLARTMKLSFVGSHVNSKQGLEHYRAMGGQAVEGDAMSPPIQLADIATWTETWFKRYPSAHTRNSTLNM